MATTVISKIVISDDGKAADITGTVGGNAHLWRRSGRPFIPKGGTNPPTTMTPQVLAQEYADHYNALAAVNTALAALAYTLYVFGTTTSAIAFDNSAPVVEVGYDQVEIVATVDTTATVVHMGMDHLIEMYRGASDYIDQIARKLYNQAKLDLKSNTSGSDYIASFTTT